LRRHLAIGCAFLLLLSVSLPFSDILSFSFIVTEDLPIYSYFLPQVRAASKRLSKLKGEERERYWQDRVHFQQHSKEDDKILSEWTADIVIAQKEAKQARKKERLTQCVFLCPPSHTCSFELIELVLATGSEGGSLLSATIGASCTTATSSSIVSSTRWGFPSFPPFSSPLADELLSVPDRIDH
jgi:hypothetical protein